MQQPTFLPKAPKINSSGPDGIARTTLLMTKMTELRKKTFTLILGTIPRRSSTKHYQSCRSMQEIMAFRSNDQLDSIYH